MQLGTTLPMEDDPMAGQLPDIIGEWEAIFRRESITGPAGTTTPIVTSQSPPPPPTPVYYPSMTQMQPTPIPWLPIILGGAVLILVVALVRA